MRVLCITSQRDALNSIRPEAEMFIGLAKAGVDLTVMTQGDSVYAGPMRQAGIRLIDYHPARKLELGAILRIRRELRRGAYDIVQMFNNKAIANGLLAAIGLPVRAITYRGQTGNISRLDPFCYLTHLSPRVDRIVCVAEAVRRDLATQVRHPEHLVTIYKGHDLAWYEGVAPAPRAGLGVPEDSVLVVCIANNRPRKGVPVLIAAAAQLPLEINASFVLVGRGMTSPEIRRLIDASGCPERFHCFEFRSDALAVTAAGDIAVLPAVRREGLPKTVIEAMALGVAPVVSDTGGSAELVVDGESGLVVPPGDPASLAQAIAALCTDPGRRRALGAAARQRLGSAFRVEDAVAAHLALFREVTTSG
ncbi:MAG: glycosyltransferase [Gammaproteobacteria bacterium]|nr:glycosyltransferase [Gammaproteobacteria bacterium PRO8]MCL4778542.1 glycosyltransferase [Gammaproteobacteria bacterium]